jgi:hypothetical protein
LEKSWSDKNIDLKLLATHISTFLEENYFRKVRTADIPNGYQILAEDSPFLNSDEYLDIKVEGQPNDFIVKLDLCRKKKSRFEPSPLLLSMFGFGYLYLKKLKSRENWPVLTGEFWRYVENSLLNLANSATPSLHEPK